MNQITYENAAALADRIRSLLREVPEAIETGATHPVLMVAVAEHRPGWHDEAWATAVPDAALPLVPFAVALHAENAYAGRYRDDALTDLGHAVGTAFEGNPRHATTAAGRALTVTRRQLATLAARLATTPDEVVMGQPDRDEADADIVEMTGGEKAGRPRTITARVTDDGVWTDIRAGLRFERPRPSFYRSTGYGKNPAVVMAEPVDDERQRFFIHDDTKGASLFLGLFGIERHTQADGDAWYEMPRNGAATDRHERAAIVSHVLNCYVLGQEEVRKANDAAPLHGGMTWFDDASNAERDALLAHLTRDGTATVRPITNGDANGSSEPEAFVVDLDGTGTTYQGNIAFRLVNAEFAELRLDWNRCDMGPPPAPWPRTLQLKPGAKPNRHELEPCRTAVLFDAFQNACSYRRHPQSSEGRECAHPKSGYNDYCDSGGCPLTTQVYSGDRERYARDDDPFFERESEREGMVLVQALTPQVRGSRAYRAAGVARINAIVDRCAGAVFQTDGKTSRYLTMGAEELAGFEAVAAGHLLVDERLSLGTVFRLNDELQALVTERYQAAVAKVAAHAAARA